MWAGLMSKDGEVKELGRALWESLDDIDTTGKPKYCFVWEDIPITIPKKFLTHAALFTAPEHGVCVGVSPYMDDDEHRNKIKVGSTIRMEWAIDFRR